MLMTDPDPDNATPFEDVDVDQDLDRFGQAPSGSTLTAGEEEEIEKQVTEIMTANAGRGADEQVSVDPAEVN
jgi:hypothetical protein